LSTVRKSVEPGHDTRVAETLEVLAEVLLPNSLPVIGPSIQDVVGGIGAFLAEASLPLTPKGIINARMTMDAKAGWAKTAERLWLI
jgi:hypothetical protein